MIGAEKCPFCGDVAVCPKADHLSLFSCGSFERPAQPTWQSSACHIDTRGKLLEEALRLLYDEADMGQSEEVAAMRDLRDRIERELAR